MPLKIYQLILKIGSLAALLAFFIVSNDLYFPYITGKQLYFNVLLELLMVPTLAMWWAYPVTRPKFNWISGGLLAFLAALLLSSIFGVDFNLSFWGDSERMLGWFSLAHFVFLYFIVISVFRSRRDWLWLFNAGIAAAAALAIYAFLTYEGNRSLGNVNMTSNISRLGNATYVAGVMLFAWWFAVYGWLKTKDWTARFFYTLAAALILAAFVFADVSGSQAGFAVSVVVFLTIWAVAHRQPEVRRRFKLGLLGLAVVLAILLTVRQAPVFDNTRLGKILRDFNWQNITLNTRLYAWRAAWLGFLERPLLGSGYGNFALWFDKYFDAEYYRWTTSEEYFDRAHNNLLDILATGGLLSLMSYVAIFVAVGYYLYRGRKAGWLELPEFSLVLAVLSAYLVHNLAVFDAIANYILLMFTLGFVYWLTQRNDTVIDFQQNQHGDRQLAAALAGLMIAAYLVFGLNYQWAKMLSATIVASNAWSTEDVGLITDGWRQALSYKTVLDRDTKSLLATQLFSNYQVLAKQPEASEPLFSLALAGLEDNLRLNPKDAMTNQFLAQAYYYRGFLLNKREDWQVALLYADAAIANGGQHIPPMMFKAAVLSSLEQTEAAEQTLRTAISWQPTYWAVYCHLADLQLAETSLTEEVLNDLAVCLKESPKAALLDVDKLKLAMDLYVQRKNWSAAIAAGELVYKQRPSEALRLNLEKWRQLAK